MYHSQWRTVADGIAADIQAGRLALDELAARRLMQHAPNRGHHVFELPQERLAHLAQLRAILEGAVADLIFDQADAAALAELGRFAARFEAEVRTGTPLEQHVANIAFHMALLALCPNPELVLAANKARNRLPSALLYQWCRVVGWPNPLPPAASRIC